jgi:hypothetical protein
MTPDEELTSVPVPRSLAERQTDARKQLESGCQMWLATGSDGHGAHLIPARGFGLLRCGIGGRVPQRAGKA